MSDPFTSAVNETKTSCFISDIVLKQTDSHQAWTDKAKSYQAFIKKKNEK